MIQHELQEQISELEGREVVSRKCLFPRQLWVDEGCIEELLLVVSKPMRIYRAHAIVPLTTKASQPLRGKPSLSEVIRAQLMQHTRHSDWICQQPRHLPHPSIVIDGIELPCIQKCIPIRHVNNELILLPSGVVKLGEKPPRNQIMIILVDLSERLTHF